LLKRTLMALLAEQGVDQSIGPDGPVVRMIDCEIVRTAFYTQTVAEGPPEQKAATKRQRFHRAVEWAQEHQLIGAREIDDTTYLLLIRPDPHTEDGETV
jgi:hypothetical protein